MIEKLLHELQEIKQLIALQKKVLTLDEFCTYAGVSKSYAYHLTSTGKIRFYRPIGKLIYFDIEDVNDFLMQNPSNIMNKKKDSVKNIFINQKF